METNSSGLLGPIIGAGASLVGQGINALASGSMNKKTREWNERMYFLQKQDALNNWNMQNSYNSPEQQMSRLTKAGLNPNLVYGNGTVANSTSAPDTPHAMPFKGEAPQFNLPQVTDTYFNIATQKQRLSNEKQIGNNLALDALIKTEDARAKNMENSYMADRGYIYKGDTARNNNYLVYEKLLAQNALNAFNFGGDTDSVNPMFGGIKKGSNYDLQAQGLSLLNNLRNLQGDNLKELTGISAIKRQYTGRMMSGKFSDLSAKDLIMLILNGVNTIKN